MDIMELKERLSRIEDAIQQACDRAGRPRSSVTLVAVTKTFPMETILAAYEAGLRHFGENRVQELIAKSDAYPGRLRGGDVHWHMIGHIQRKKAKDVVAHADLVHAIDSLRLAEALNSRAAAAGRVVPVLIQVNVSGETSKFGIAPPEALTFAEQVASYEHLEIKGLMTLAAPAPDPELVRPEFALLRSIFDKLGDFGNTFPAMEYLSMGMSGDFEVAIEEGATHVRIGSALFGSRY